MLSTMLGMGIGAAATFFADPQGGQRRRAQAREQFIRASRQTQGALDATARDLANRKSEWLDTVAGLWNTTPSRIFGSSNASAQPLAPGARAAIL